MWDEKTRHKKEKGPLGPRSPATQQHLERKLTWTLGHESQSSFNFDD
jgi:hypothetical protein